MAADVTFGTTKTGRFAVEPVIITLLVAGVGGYAARNAFVPSERLIETSIAPSHIPPRDFDMNLPTVRLSELLADAEVAADRDGPAVSVSPVRRTASDTPLLRDSVRGRHLAQPRGRQRTSSIPSHRYAATYTISPSAKTSEAPSVTAPATMLAAPEAVATTSSARAVSDGPRDLDPGLFAQPLALTVPAAEMDDVSLTQPMIAEVEEEPAAAGNTHADPDSSDVLEVLPLAPALALTAPTAKTEEASLLIAPMAMAGGMQEEPPPATDAQTDPYSVSALESSPSAQPPMARMSAAEADPGASGWVGKKVLPDNDPTMLVESKPNSDRSLNVSAKNTYLLFDRVTNFEIPVQINGVDAGPLPIHADNNIVYVRLRDILLLVKNKMSKESFDRLNSSKNAEELVTLQDVRNAGIGIIYEAARHQLLFGVY